MSMRQQSRRPSRPAPQAPGKALLAPFLDPINLLSEAICSVLILLTFTLAFRALSVAGQVEQPSSEIYAIEFVVAAVGAILAWGLIDGLMYMLLEMHVPFMQSLLRIARVTLEQFLILAALAGAILVVMELYKLIRRKTVPALKGSLAQRG
jgi:hypothetical protein